MLYKRLLTVIVNTSSNQTKYKIKRKCENDFTNNDSKIAKS